jgi:hypothetical protein
MPPRYIVYAMLFAFAAVGCGGSHSRAISLAHDIGVSKLRADLQALVASPAGRQHEIPKSEWPESLRRFQPLAVERHMTGVLVVLNRADREQEGLLVMLDPKDDPGAGGSGASYDALGDGLFWCWEKIRDPYIPQSQGTNK